MLKSCKSQIKAKILHILLFFYCSAIINNMIMELQ